MKTRILATCVLALAAVSTVHAETTLPLTFGDKAGFCVLAVFMGVLAQIDEEKGFPLTRCEGDHAVDVNLINGDGEGTAALGALNFDVKREITTRRGDNWSVVSNNPGSVYVGGVRVISVNGRCTNDEAGFMITANSLTAIGDRGQIPVFLRSTFSQRLDESGLSWGTSDDIPPQLAVVGRGSDVISKISLPWASFPRQFWRERLKYRRPNANGLPGLITMRSVRRVPELTECTLLLKNATVNDFGGGFQISPGGGGEIQFQ